MPLSNLLVLLACLWPLTFWSALPSGAAGSHQLLRPGALPADDVTGKIKTVALTNFDTKRLQIILENGIPVASNQVSIGTASCLFVCLT